MENNKETEIANKLISYSQNDSSSTLSDELTNIPASLLVDAVVEICSKAPELVSIVMEKISHNIEKDIENELETFKTEIDAKVRLMDMIWEKYSIREQSKNLDLNNSEAVANFLKLCEAIEMAIDKNISKIATPKRKSILSRLFGR